MPGSGTATLDFGAFPGTTHASVAVTGQAGIVAGSIVGAWLRPEATPEHTADEHVVELLDVVATDVVAGVGFTVQGVHKNALLVPGEPIKGRATTSVPAQVPQGFQQPRSEPRGTTIYGRWSVAWAWA